MMNKVNLEKQTDPTYEKPMEFKTLQHRGAPLHLFCISE